jgi:hypothetical protein
MRRIFEYEYKAKRELPANRKRIDDYRFIIHKEQTQRPIGIVLVKLGYKRRKLDISANTKSEQKERKEKEACKAKEEKLKAQIQAKKNKARMCNRSTRAGAKLKTTATINMLQPVNR